MSRSSGVWVSPTEFVSFAAPSQKSLSQEIVTRDRSPDFGALGMYLPNPDPVLKRMGKDVSAYRDLLSDAHVGGCVRRRKAAVKSLERGIDQGTASSKHTKRMEAMVQRLDMDRILGQAIDAAMFGYQPLEVMWGTHDGWIMPLDVVAKPSEWFLFDAESELRFRSREAMLLGEMLPARKFLLPRNEASYLNPYGKADLAMCFWPATFKRGGLKFWVTFTEKYGTPWLVGKTPRNTPESERNTLLDQLESMVQDAVAVIPDDASVEIIEGQKTSSSEIYRELLMYCRGEISIALLGQNQTTEAEANRASATAGMEVTRDIRDSDVGMIEASINQLVRWVLEVNTGSSENAPVFTMWEQEEVDERQAARDEILSRAGVRFSKSYWMRSYDLREDDLETAQALPAVAFAESPEHDDGKDALDEIIEQEMADWQPVMQAMADPIQRAINEALKRGETAEELLKRLPDLMTDIPADELQERLARAAFAARLLAASGVRVQGLGADDEAAA